jgi:Fe-Mn family superoxide dismutase
MKFELPELTYDYNALEPYVDAKTMEIHHSKHHQGYVNKLNAALEGYQNFQDKPLEELLGNLDSLPEEIRNAVKNNGGGHFNHSLFWRVMGPDAGGAPEGELAEKIDATFGNFEVMKDTFSNAAATQFGSGWAWLVKNSEGGLEIYSTANQDTPISHGKAPILGLDIWEHAYYLKYQNKRPEYIENWWNVVNWKAVSELYNAA